MAPRTSTGGVTVIKQQPWWDNNKFLPIVGPPTVVPEYPMTRSSSPPHINRERAANSPIDEDQVLTIDISHMSRSSSLLQSSNGMSFYNHAVTQHLPKAELVAPPLIHRAHTVSSQTPIQAPRARRPLPPRPDSYTSSISTLSTPRLSSPGTRFSSTPSYPPRRLPDPPTWSQRTRDGSISPAPSLSSSLSTPTMSASGLPLTPSPIRIEFGRQAPSIAVASSARPVLSLRFDSEQDVEFPNVSPSVYSADKNKEKAKPSDPQPARAESPSPEDDLDWYTRAFSDRLMVPGPLPSSLPSRPESAYLSPRTTARLMQQRYSKPLPSIPKNAQEEEGQEVVVMLPVPNRPPPRTPIPADVERSAAEDLGNHRRTLSRDKGKGKEKEEECVRIKLPLTIPVDPLDLEAELAELLEDAASSPSEFVGSDDEDGDVARGGAVLQSRWSMSTMASAVGERNSLSSYLPFDLGRRVKSRAVF